MTQCNIKAGKNALFALTRNFVHLDATRCL
jgi:hypothetical protein